MPVSISFHPELKLAVSRPTGTVAAGEANAAWGDFYARHHSLAGCAIVVDHRHATAYDLDHAQVRAMVQAHVAAVAAGIAPARIAEFAPADLGFGMARMFELIATAQVPTEMAVFDRIEDLAHWLDLPASVLQEVLDRNRPQMRDFGAARRGRGG